MLKKHMNLVLILVILSGITALVFAEIAYAQELEKNPFRILDITREESLRSAKEEVSGHELYSLSLDEHKQMEEGLKVSSGKRYIVRFKEDVSMLKIYEIVELYQYKIIGNSEQRIFMIDLDDIQDFEKRTTGCVEFIEEDEKQKSHVIPSDKYYSTQWALSALNISKAWDINKGSNSVYIAIIDSGVYSNHPDFAGTDIRKGWDYIFDENCDWDSTGHGTNIIGIIGAKTNNGLGIAGINWNIAIIPLRVIYSDGSAYFSDTIDAIYDAADIGCKVINLSLGSNAYSAAYQRAISYAVSKGCIIVASAGNDGTSTYNYPASYDGVISVGSIDIDLSYSSFSQFNNRVDVTAPGSDIITTAYWIDADGYDYEYVDGTSFSTPHVSGIAALAAACKPSITTAEFNNALIQSCTDLGISGYDIHYGYGLVNAEKLLLAVIGDEYYFSKGKELYDQGKYTEALDMFNKAISINPNIDYYYDWKGYCLMDLQRYEEGLNAYNCAILITPDDWYYYNQKGVCLQYLERNEEALVAFNNAIQLGTAQNPVAYYVYSNKGICLYDLERYQEALDSINQSIILNPNESNYRWKGNCLFGLGRYEEAITAYKDVLKYNAGNEYVFFMIGQCFLELNRFDDAINYYNQSLAIKPNPICYNNKAYTLCMLLRFEEALETVELGLAIEKNEASLFRNKSRALIGLKRYSEALEAINLALAINPTDEKSLVLRAQINNIINPTATEIRIDGKNLDGFDPATERYNVELPYGTTVLPTVTAVASDPSLSVAVTFSNSLPGAATVTITSGDGKNSKTYTICFTLAQQDECFIATAAFGSKFEPAVVLLRHFRDQYLLANSIGKEFVEFYYRNSPPIATLIANSEPLKVWVRFMLIPVLAMVYSIMHPGVAVGCIFGLALLLLQKRNNIRS